MEYGFEKERAEARRLSAIKRSNLVNITVQLLMDNRMSRSKVKKNLKRNGINGIDESEIESLIDKAEIAIKQDRAYWKDFKNNYAKGLARRSIIIGSISIIGSLIATCICYFLAQEVGTFLYIGFVGLFSFGCERLYHGLKYLRKDYLISKPSSSSTSTNALSITPLQIKNAVRDDKRHGGYASDECAIIGAIVGDIIGSAHELEGTRIKTTEFELFPDNVTFTDDTVMTMAVMKWLSEIYRIPADEEGLVPIMKDIGLRYMEVGYGHSFKQWLCSDNPKPYNSCGNGSAMRVTAAGLFGENIAECQKIARISASVSHNHPEGIKGAEVVATAIHLARIFTTKECIKTYIEKKYGYDLSRTLDEIRPTYCFDPTCQGSVPEAVVCFLESNDVESAIRNAVSLGGDSDTQACIAGAIAGAYYGTVPHIFVDKIEHLIPKEVLSIITRFLCLNNDICKTICYEPSEDINELRRVLGVEWSFQDII